MPNNFFCRICGLEQLSPPWGEDNNTPTFEICDCCGVEFGYEDCSTDSIKNYRNNWMKNGAKWFNSKVKPKDWNLEKQIANIPSEFK